MRTLFILMAEYGTADVPVKDVALKYFGHNARTANMRARKQRYPFPVRRPGGERSPYVVALEDLAKWIDEDREMAQKDWSNMRDAG